MKDKSHYYHIAGGSATECAAVLDELVDYGLLAESRMEAPEQVPGSIVAMLIGLLRSLDEREPEDMAQ